MEYQIVDLIFNLVSLYNKVADRDYNDFIISISTICIDENIINETSIF